MSLGVCLFVWRGVHTMVRQTVRWSFFCIVVLLAWSAAFAPLALSQQGGALVDRPIAVGDRQRQARLEAAIAPFSELGRNTYPAARQRFLAGLPTGYKFFVVSEIADRDGAREQLFILVKRVESGTIFGTIASKLLAVTGRATDGDVTIAESAVKDWSIVAPDGVEEGNYVGRFLDHYRPGKFFIAVFGLQLTEDGHPTQARFALVSDDSGQPLNMSLPPAWLSKAAAAIETGRWASPSQNRASTKQELFVPLAFDPDQPEEVRFLK